MISPLICNEPRLPLAPSKTILNSAVDFPPLTYADKLWFYRRMSAFVSGSIPTNKNQNMNEAFAPWLRPAAAPGELEFVY